MNNLGISGKILIKDDTFAIIRIKFKKLYKIMKSLIILSNKTSIDEQFIQKKSDEYLINQSIFNINLNIQVCILFNKYCKEPQLYLINGFSRIKIGIHLYEKYSINNFLIFNCVVIKNIDELKKHYNNIHDHHVQYSLIFNNNIIEQQNYNIFKKYILQKSNHFSKMSTKYRYSIIEFDILLEQLFNNEYFNNETSIDKIIEKFERDLNIFYDIISYYEYNTIEDRLKYFYVDEFECVRDKDIFILKNNNLFDFLLDNSVIPFHKFKSKIKTIHNQERINTWHKHFKNTLCETCSVLKCTNTMYNKVNGFGYKNGEKIDLVNIMPICKKCKRHKIQKNEN